MIIIMGTVSRSFILTCIFVRLTFVRNEGRKYLYSKQEHPRHLLDPNDEAKRREDITLSEHMFINKHHTNIQGDACYGDAGTILSDVL